MVRFEQERHKYFHIETGEEYKSVTTILGLYEPHFDSENVAKAVAKRDGRTKEDVLAEWKHINQVANDKGNFVHNLLEEYLKCNRLYIPKTPKEKKLLLGFQKIEHHIDYGEEQYPEKILWNDEYKVAGMSDLIIKNDDEYFSIVDYKGLPLDTPIFTSNGWKTMGNLTLKDKVFDSDGKLTKIKVISDIKNKECYEIKFDNGEKVISDFEHRWLISFLRGKKRKDVVMTTIELFNYMNELTKTKRKDSCKIPKIFCAKPLKISKTKLPIDPYVFGVWLGDGNSADGKITNMHEKVWLEIEKRGYNVGKDVSGGSSGLATTRTIFGLGRELRKLGLLKNKHLPDLFLKSSFNQRLDILRGLMDSDGYYNKTRKRYVMSTTKKWQVKATTMLVSSLGLKATTFKYNQKLNNKSFTVYNVCFTSHKLNPFLTRNQDINIESKIDCSKHRNIMSVTKVESVPTICIEVESPKHTFLFGHSFIVTHNTNKKFNFYSPYNKHLLEPLSHLQDCQYTIYSLQLSIYAYLYEQISGLKCKRLMITYLADSEEFLFKVFPIMYLRNDVKILLNHYKENYL